MRTLYDRIFSKLSRGTVLRHLVSLIILNTGILACTRQTPLSSNFPYSHRVSDIGESLYV
jgi:hypothetical protein